MLFSFRAANKRQEWMECMIRIGAVLFRKETNNGSVARALQRFMLEVRTFGDAVRWNATARGCVRFERVTMCHVNNEFEGFARPRPLKGPPIARMRSQGYFTALEPLCLSVAESNTQ